MHSYAIESDVFPLVGFDYSRNGSALSWFGLADFVGCGDRGRQVRQKQGGRHQDCTLHSLQRPAAISCKRMHRNGGAWANSKNGHLVRYEQYRPPYFLHESCKRMHRSRVHAQPIRALYSSLSSQNSFVQVVIAFALSIEALLRCASNASCKQFR
jgi:hypothetical protein